MSATHLEPANLMQHFQVQAAKVFDAWIKPEMIRLWLFKSPESEIIDVEIDAQPGGRFSILEYNKQKEYIDHFGKYQQISRPGLLVFSLKVPKHFSGETRVVVQIKEETDGCLLTLTQTGVEPEKTEDHWRYILTQLKTILKP